MTILKYDLISLKPIENEDDEPQRIDYEHDSIETISELLFKDTITRLDKTFKADNNFKVNLYLNNKNYTIGYFDEDKKFFRSDKDVKYDGFLKTLQDFHDLITDAQQKKIEQYCNQLNLNFASSIYINPLLSSQNSTNIPLQEEITIPINIQKLDNGNIKINQFSYHHCKDKPTNINLSSVEIDSNGKEISKTLEIKILKGAEEYLEYLSPVPKQVSKSIKNNTDFSVPLNKESALASLEESQINESDFKILSKLKERDEKYLESDKKADLFLNFLKGSQDEKELKKLKEGLSKHRNFFGFGKTESLKILKNESSELYQKLKKNNKKLH